MSDEAVDVTINAALAERLARLAEKRQISPTRLLEGLLAQSLDLEESEAEWDRRAQESADAFDRDGLHLTHQEVLDWMARRMKGEDAPPPPCHT